MIFDFLKKEISLEEKKKVQIDMLKEIDEFCSLYQIRYSLAFGTLLGAIRHKGFIPWDDDLDIMMPLPDMIKFKQKLNSDTLQYLDVDTTPHYDMPFSRIAHKNTYSRYGLFNSKYGIDIDLYPIISISDNEKEREEFFYRASLLQEKRKKFMKKRSIICRYLPFSTIPGHDLAMKNYRDFLMTDKSYGSTKTYYIIAGPIPLRNKMIYDRDIFSELISVDFEGHSFKAVAQYDYFLKLRYGDYMQLPPENERCPYHGGEFYWK